ncbi:MAG: CRISPR-associated helicase Cas3' [Minicystis sp.]
MVGTGEDAPYFRYWGKADPKIGGYHLAVFHCLDVAAVAEEVFAENQRLRERFAGWMGTLESSVSSIVALLVALHDIGKIDARFQVKAPAIAEALCPAWQRIEGRHRQSYDHGGAGYGHLLRDLGEVVEAKLGEPAWPLLQAVTGHHGELPGRKKAEDAARWAGTLSAADQTARAAFLQDVIELFSRRGAALPLLKEPGWALVVMLAGLCSVADWIGSNVDFFPYVEQPQSLEAHYVTHARPRAQRALATLGLRSAIPSGKVFSEIFGFPPRDVQRVTEALSIPEGPCMIVVEAQMGSGKTEAALSLAERLLARGDASGVYVALPTMATSNAMLERLERDLPRMFQGSLNLVLSHGRREMHDGFQKIVSRRGSTANPYRDEATVVCNRWLLGRKRALLGQVGVGTVDQAMLAALRVRHHFVRAYALAESVVILDEVHAYDAYMQVILDRLIEWLGALGTPVLLLSATLPACTRRLFVEAYARGAGFSLAPAEDRLPVEAPYPLVTMVSSAGVGEKTLDEQPPFRTVALEIVATSEPEDQILPRLIEAARGGAMVAWIRNTVTDAQRVASHPARSWRTANRGMVATWQPLQLPQRVRQIHSARPAPSRYTRCAHDGREARVDHDPAAGWFRGRAPLKVLEGAPPVLDRSARQGLG